MAALRRFALLATLIAALVSSAPPRSLSAADPIPPAAPPAPAPLPPEPSVGCYVYPIGVLQSKLDGAPGSPAPVPLPNPDASVATIKARYPDSVFTVAQAAGDTSFWFATWDGDQSAAGLRLSLDGGGTLGAGFTEAFTPSNGLLERGDYAMGYVGSVAALEEQWLALRDDRVRMAVPVIDHFRGDGANSGMHVARFAVVRLLNWQMDASPRTLTFALAGDGADYACFHQSRTRATVGQPITFTAAMPEFPFSPILLRYGDYTGTGSLPDIHAYAATGTFRPLLSVTTSGRVTAYARSTVLVEPAPAVDFAAGPARIGQAIAFTGAISGTAPLTATWDFGDGARAAGPNATHAYAALGPYSVTLSVEDRNGFVVTSRRLVEVYNDRAWLPVAGRGSALAPPAP